MLHSNVFASHIDSGSTVLYCGENEDTFLGLRSLHPSAQQFRLSDHLETLSGDSLPFGDQSFAAVVLDDVVHHAYNPFHLLREARRLVTHKILIKDYVNGALGVGLGLQLWDWLQRRRHRLPLNCNYWPALTWRNACQRLGLRIDAWRSDLGPNFWASLTPVEPASSSSSEHIAWELAYSQFETPQTEVSKFETRLLRLGAGSWNRQSRIVEIFCGRGNGMVALANLGFGNVEGVDLSAALLAQYRGASKLYEADCRALPFADKSRDILIVQGGLHHLETLEDLQKVLQEAQRVLVDGGMFVCVEPWLTPFLQFVHVLMGLDFFRLLYPKLDALNTMTRYEEVTYYRWLRSAAVILPMLESYFSGGMKQTRFGKLMFWGRKS